MNIPSGIEFGTGSLQSSADRPGSADLLVRRRSSGGLEEHRPAERSRRAEGLFRYGHQVCPGVEVGVSSQPSIDTGLRFFAPGVAETRSAGSGLQYAE